MKKKKQYIVCNSVFLLALFVLFFLIMRVSVLDFDAGMNFMVSKYLVLNGDYATFYNEYKLFDHVIQTAGIVVFATALLNWLFGICTVNMQIVTVIFLCLLIGSIFFYLSKKVNWISNFLIVLWIAMSPNTIRVGVVGYGEIPIGFFMIAAILLYKKAMEEKSVRLYFVVGIIMGIGYLTKTIFIIVAPTFAIWIFIDIIRSKGKVVKYYIIMLLGMLFPVFLFEFYKLYSLGITDYKEWWKFEFDAILGQAGLTDKYMEADEMVLLEKIKFHYIKYAQGFNISAKLLVFLYIIPGAFYLYEYVKKKKFYQTELMIYMISVSYFGWWCVLSPSSKLFIRRILIGHIFIMIIMGIICARGMLHMIHYCKKWKVSITCVLIILYVTALIPNICLLKDDIDFYWEIADSTKELVKEVQKLPEDAVLYGCGWLQAPVIGTMSNRVIYDIEKNEVSGESYFVYDIYVYWLSPDYLHYIFDSEADYSLKYESGNQKLYQLNTITVN